MDVEANYTDTHGQSIPGFELTRLLGFDPLPQIKAVNRVRLYPARFRDVYPQLGAAMMQRPIRWDLIADQDGQMIKYATTIRTRSAQTATILRGFQQTNLMHPTYQAMLEVARPSASARAVPPPPTAAMSRICPCCSCGCRKPPWCTSTR